MGVPPGHRGIARRRAAAGIAVLGLATLLTAQRPTQSLPRPLPRPPTLQPVGGLARAQSAQVPPAATPDPAAPPAAAPGEESWIALTEYGEAVSRGAFTACDANGDDRLSLIEAARSLEAVRDLRDVAAFRRLDASADGYLDWAEFDARFRELAARGTALRIKPRRPFDPKALAPAADPEQPPATVAASPVARVLAALDTDRSGGIGLDEARAALLANGVPTELLVQLPRIDLDGSGELSEAELAPFASLLSALPFLQTTATTTAATGETGALPPGYREADTNGDGVLDRGELGAVLKAVDPTLERWLPRVLADADQTRNGTLGPLEIANAERRRATER